jgi:hypothetical protein
LVAVSILIGDFKDVLLNTHFYALRLTVDMSEVQEVKIQSSITRIKYRIIRLLLKVKAFGNIILY